MGILKPQSNGPLYSNKVACTASRGKITDKLRRIRKRSLNPYKAVRWVTRCLWCEGFVMEVSFKPGVREETNG